MPWTRTEMLCEELERREVPASMSALVDGVLRVVGDNGDNRLEVYSEGGLIVVRDGTRVLGRFDSAAVDEITIDANGGHNTVIVSNTIAQSATIAGGGGTNKFVGGSGATTFLGGEGRDYFFGGNGVNTFDAKRGRNQIARARPTDIVFANPGDLIFRDILPPETQAQDTLSATDVSLLLQRAAAASASSDAIIVVTDRNGRILGARVESGVDPAIRGNLDNLVFAIDGAYAKALTAAYFASNESAFTSRTVQFMSQSVITQREVESNPNITDPNSTDRGPGFVAPVGTQGRFPPGAARPQFDFFQVEHTNRDGAFSPGPDRIVGTADDIALDERFNIDDAFVPEGHALFTPASYGDQSGRRPRSQSRGIATLPGGVPIYKNGVLVGGIGVFFPGQTGYATEENSALSETFDPSKPDRSIEAEYIAFAAVGGYGSGLFATPIEDIAGVELPDGISGIPSGRIDIYGAPVDIVGPGGIVGGLKAIMAAGETYGEGNPGDGTNQVLAGGFTLLNGEAVPEGWLVLPHDGDGVSAMDAARMVAQGITQANLMRSTMRLPVGSKPKMVFAVTDRQGEVVALYRMPDAAMSALDIAIAKARNVAYFADPAQLQPEDQVPTIPVGTAFSNRTIRYLAQPHFPETTDTGPAGPFSQLNDGGVDPLTGLQVGPRLPASAYQSAVGYDAFNPGTNFRQEGHQPNQNGVVFFDASAPVYVRGAIAGGFGVSGDGVDHDDVVTAFGQVGFTVPAHIFRADQTTYDGIRLPYQKFKRS